MNNNPNNFNNFNNGNNNNNSNNNMNSNNANNNNANNNNSNNNNGGGWMNHPNLSGMDPGKLAMLQSLADQGSQKNQSDMMSFLMSTASNSKSNGMQFSQNEIDTIIEVLKVGKSPAEMAKIERMLQLMKMLR